MPLNLKANEQGSVLLFAIVVILILVTLLAVAIDLATVAWHQRQLAAVTDAAALAGAQALDEEALYTRGAGEVIPLEPALVQAMAYEYLGLSRAPERFNDFAAEISSDRQTVLVQTSASITPPLRGGFIGPVTLRATALATNPIR